MSMRLAYNFQAGYGLLFCKLGSRLLRSIGLLMAILLFPEIVKNRSQSRYKFIINRGGSGAGSLGGAQQLTGGRGVVAEIFRDLQKPARFSGGGVVAEMFRDLQKPVRFSGEGGGVVAEIFRDLQKPARFSGGRVVAEMFRDLQKPARFSGEGGG